MTLREEVDKICDNNLPWKETIDELVAFIESRDEVERERVKQIIVDGRGKAWTVHDVIKAVYPPKVEMLPAGWYGVKAPNGNEYPYVFTQPTLAHDGFEYRPIKNPFEE